MSNFVDEANFCARAGNGGAGCVSFRREAHVSMGGPDGGDGGSGGAVWLEADPQTVSLLAFRDHPHRIADSGKHGKGAKQHGKSGKDMFVKVPVGTVVKDHETGEVIVDLVNPGDRWLAAPAGEGGKGNARFLSNRRRAPAFAEQGEYCEDTWYKLELKLLADVALVGFPSAGKSTLISVVSNAKPKIAEYHFTTLTPNLGVVRLDDDNEFIMADLPGLIEGASEGKGMGFRFLRHMERARVLLFLIDLADVEGKTPKQQFDALRAELENYKPELLDLPYVVAGSKADVLEGSDWEGEKPEEMSFEISSITQSNTTPLMWKLAELVKQERAREPEPTDFIVHRPVPEGVTVERDFDGAWRVYGRPAERAVAISDLTDYVAMEYVQNKLRDLGVERALKKAGVKPGETVRIASFAFEYQDDL